MAQKTVNGSSGKSVAPSSSGHSVPVAGSLGLHFGIAERGANDTGNWKPMYTPSTTYGYGAKASPQRGANDTGNSKNSVVVAKKING